MKRKPNLSDPCVARLAHFARGTQALFRGKVGGKTWKKHFYRWWRSLLGDARFLPKPITQPAVPNPQAAINALSTQISALQVEVRRQRNLQDRTLLRHRSELGTSAAANPSYRLLQVARTLDPLLTLRSKTVCMIGLAVGGAYRELVHSCLLSQNGYCERHGYSQLVLEHEPPPFGRPPAWLKLPLALRALELGFEHVFFIDADCLITNPVIPLENHFARWNASHRTSSMLVAEDEGGINSGCFFLRNTPDAPRLLDAVWLYDADPFYPSWEQEALMRLLNDHEEFRKVLHIEPEARLFNSFPHERLEFMKRAFDQRNTWQPGDFICHFSGVRGTELKRLISRYETEIRND